MALVKPHPLKPGDLIALIAPSSFCTPEDSAEVKIELEKLGFPVYVHPQCLARDHMSAGTAAEKIAALHDVFANPEVKAVFCLRGGYRAIHMLDGLDYGLIAANPKILLGYSDITALHSAIYARTGLVTFHGPTARGFADLADASLVAEGDVARKALTFLGGSVPENLFQDHPVKTIRPGKASGRLWGGNLQLVSALIEAGSRYHPPFDKAILVIEDISEEISKIDRQLGAWRLRGIFKNLAGLVVGHMTDIKDTPGRAGAFVHNLETLIREHTQGMAGPVVMHAPFGHELPNHVFPQGVKAQLAAEKGDARLSLLESPFAGA